MFVLGNGLVLSVLGSQSLGPGSMPGRKFNFPFFPSSPVSAEYFLSYGIVLE